MENILIWILNIVSTGFLGLLVGALLAEGFIFVPYWKSLAADVFFSLHKEYGPRLYRFFAPLTIAGTLFPIIAAITTLIIDTKSHWSTVVAGILSALMVGIYLFYFKSANEKLAEAKMNSDELAAELNSWDYWHKARVIIGIVAFIVSLIGLRG